MHHCHAMCTCMWGCNQAVLLFNHVPLGDVVHSIVLRSKMIAIDSKVASDCLTAYWWKTSSMPLAEISRASMHAVPDFASW